MIRVLMKPKVMEWWADDVISFVREVYGDGRLEPLNVIFFREDQTADAGDWLHRLAGEYVSPRTITMVVLGSEAIYVPPIKLVVQPVFLTLMVPIFWFTESFFHEVTHHVVYNTSTLPALTKRVLEQTPTVARLLEESGDEQLAKDYMSWVDELFAHYVEACYLRKLEKQPCDATEWFKRASSLTWARQAVVKAVGEARGEVERELTKAEASPDTWRILHDTFAELTERSPTDVYEKYLERPHGRSIFEGREEVLRRAGDP